MPSFEIPDGPTTVKLTEGADATKPRTGSIVFTVNNKSGEVRSGTLSVQVAGQSKAEWFTIDGERERGFDPVNSETATIKIAVPGDVAAGNYPFRLRVVAVNDPDNDHTDGPATTVEVPPSAQAIVPPSPKWPWIVGALVLLAVIGGLAWAFWPKKDKPIKPGATETAAPPQSTMATVPDLKGKNITEAQALAPDFDITQQVVPVTGNAPGTIIDQNPAAGTTQTKRFPLKVKVDPGVQVPQAKGTSITSAINTIVAATLKPGQITSQCDTSVPENQVIDQSPPAGGQVASNTVITMTVASRPNGGANCGLIYWPIQYMNVEKLHMSPAIKKSLSQHQ